jgi:hypothetical protein
MKLDADIVKVERLDWGCLPLAGGKKQYIFEFSLQTHVRDQDPRLKTLWKRSLPVERVSTA